MVYIIHPDVDVWNFVVKGVDDGCTVITRPLNKHSNKLQLAFRKVFANSQLSGELLFDSQLCHELRQLNDGDSVVVCDHYELCLFRTLSAMLNPKVKKFFWIWNPVKVQEKNFYKCLFCAMNEVGFISCTFDPHDSKEFGIKLYSQFFRMNQDVKNGDEIIDDFYFIGYAKNRESVVINLEKQLSQYKTHFKIVYSTKESIPYEENIKNMRRARCLVEIVQQGQSGMTLRPLEAIALGKKLLSNNKALQKQEFYHPQNIFILGIDSIDRLKDFMNTPIVPVSINIIQKYDISTWINHFK